jgi:hypothetical protein
LCTNNAIGTPQGALPRQAPIGTLLDHVENALFAPGRRPLGLLDVAQRIRAQTLLIHADEPLRRGAKDQRRLVAPAMRIAVPDLLVFEQTTSSLELLDDEFATLIHLETGDKWCAFAEASIAHHRDCPRAGCI